MSHFNLWDVNSGAHKCRISVHLLARVTGSACTFILLVRGVGMQPGWTESGGVMVTRTVR